MLRATVVWLVLAMLAAPTVALAQGDWTVRRDPFDRTVVARYKALLAANPHDTPALNKLVEMYRRHRTVRALETEIEVQLADHREWATLVVMGHLRRLAGERPRALELYDEAVALRPDTQLWMLVAELGKPADARSAYATALHHAKTTAQKRAALRKLVAIAIMSRDHDGTDSYFDRLLELDPRDSRLWIERGDAMLAANKPELAVTSYAAAEKLLQTDPKRRIDVIVQRAQALERMANHDDAVAEFRRALALAPRGHDMVGEITAHIIAIYRRRKTLPELLASYEALWPERTRDAFAWRTLATLYDETGTRDRAITALDRAIEKAPSDLDTQWRLISLLDSVGRSDEALARVEVIARGAPRDVSLQLLLAKRQWKRHEQRALDTLARLAQSYARDAVTLTAIAELYVEWNRVDLATATYRTLGRANAKTRDLAAIKTFAKTMLDQGIWDVARESYLAAIELAPNDVELWTGRASAYQGLEIWLAALRDADHALTLIGNDVSARAARRRARHLFVQILMRLDVDRRDPYVNAWHNAFEVNPPDLEAGYFLADYYAVAGGGDLRSVLSRLHRFVPDDETVTRELAHAPPTELDRVRSWIPDPFPEHRVYSSNAGDPLAKFVRAGLRIGIGTGVYGDVDHTLNLGVSVAIRLTDEAHAHLRPAIAMVWRVDWSQHQGNMTSVHGIASSLGFAARALTTSKATLMIGGAQRIEKRFGAQLERSGWGSGGLATDITADLVIRNAPFTIGARFEQWFSGRATALLELVWELR